MHHVVDTFIRLLFGSVTCIYTTKGSCCILNTFKAPSNMEIVLMLKQCLNLNIDWSIFMHKCQTFSVNWGHVWNDSIFWSCLPLSDSPQKIIWNQSIAIPYHCWDATMEWSSKLCTLWMGILSATVLYSPQRLHPQSMFMLVWIFTMCNNCNHVPINIYSE